jgi:hypothetical protein
MTAPDLATTARQLIPGAYERNTLTRRQSGSMGGPAFGSTGIPAGPSSLDNATAAERHKEGGGRAGTNARPHEEARLAAE